MTNGSGAQDDREEAVAALRQLAGLADHAESRGWPKLAAALRTTAVTVEVRLQSSELTIAIAGGRAKRTLLNVLAGEVLFVPEATEPSSTFLVMRRARRLGWVARKHDGHLEQFATKHPDRAAWYERELAKAEKELDAAKLGIKTIDDELTAKEETLSERRVRAAERMRDDLGAAERARAFVAAILAWILGVLRIRVPPRLAAPPSRREAVDGRVVSAMIARRDVERAMTTARGWLEERENDVAHIRKDAAQHDEERRAAFVASVRELTDATHRGADIADLTLEISGGVLPEGIAVIDAPAAIAPRAAADSEVRNAHLREMRDRAGACFLVASPGSVAVGDLEDAVRPIIPYVLDATDADGFGARIADALPGLFERARAEEALAVLALALADMPSRMQALAAAVAAGEAELETRIEALERERLPEPKKFREEQLAKMATSIEEGARRVLKRAVGRLRERSATIERDWIAAIENAPNRTKLAEVIALLDASMTDRFRQLVDDVGDDIGAEMHSTTEVLEAWALEDVRRRYKTRLPHRDKTAPVIAELPSDEIAALQRPPLGRVLRAFTRRRVGIAFGSMASATAIGGALDAMAGAAIGAGVGLVAGAIASFAPRVQSLKRECTRQVRESVAAVEKAIAAWLEGSHETFVRDISAAVDATLEHALKRRDQSIIRLIDLEGKALEREQAKLRDLGELKTALDEHAAQFARLAHTSASALREHVARTRN